MTELPRIPDGYQVVYSTWGDSTFRYGERHYVFPGETHTRCYRELDRTSPDVPQNVRNITQCHYCEKKLKRVYRDGKTKLTDAQLEQLRRAVTTPGETIQTYHSRGTTLESLERMGLMVWVSSRTFKLTRAGIDAVFKWG